MEPADVRPPELHPGDAIRVMVWREEDLSGDFPVDDRGIVTLPLLGERNVEGVHPDTLRERLAADYREYIRNPSIDITVLRRVNILGEVGMPGLYPVDATISLSEALGLAGGITPNGNPEDIRLLRDGRVIQQDLDQASRIGPTDIRSGDQIFVGQKSWLSRNPGALVGSLIAAAAVITTALIR